MLSLFPGSRASRHDVRGSRLLHCPRPRSVVGRRYQAFPSAGRPLRRRYRLPACQAFSRLRHIVEANGYETAPDLIPEYERVTAAAAPTWFLMENVPGAYEPHDPGYQVRSELVADHWCGGETSRLRLSFGTRDGRRLNIETLALHRPDPEHSALASGGGRPVPVAIGGSGKTKGKREKRLAQLRLQDSRRIPKPLPPAGPAGRFRSTAVHGCSQGQSGGERRSARDGPRCR